MHRALLAGLAVILMGAAASADESKRNRLQKKQHTTSNAPFLKPEEAVAKMSIPEGFEVSIFASEPDIGEPIAFCFDDRGRIWVVENYNYRTRGAHTDDQVTRIQILEDTDRDGVFDKKTTFTDKLTFTSGIALGFGGVFVGSPPNLSFIPDANQDDVPDGPPEVLLDGWGINDRHETLNSFIWGPEGWLYGCHGVFTRSRVAKPGEPDSARQFIDGGIWRYHPVRQKFEIFARGLSNPWGFDFDDHGQGFATCCVIPHLFHIVQGGVYHKQSLPHVNPHVYDDIKTIRDHKHLSAHGGARFYLADTFPAKYRGRLFMCNIHEHAVLTDVLVPEGSSFVGKHGDDFMPANDLAWVGFSVEIGPDGAVYILDWHDTDVCGNKVNFPNSGRVYRIIPNGTRHSPAPNLRSLSDEQLVKLQQHSNDWYVRQAHLLLHTRATSGKLDESAVRESLEQQMASATTSAKRLRALWAMHVCGVLGKERLTELLRDDDQHIRAWAIQLLADESPVNAFEPVPTTDPNVLPPDVLQRLSRMASADASPVVRLHLSAIAQRLPHADRWPILEPLSQRPEDVNDRNLPYMLWFALEPMVLENPERALQLAVESAFPKLPEFVARRMLAGDTVVASGPMQSLRDQLFALRHVAKGFRVQDVGERGVAYHSSFRNRKAVETHPLNRQTPCVIHRKIAVPEGKKTSLKLSVSHHPHGDWQLRVLANKEVLADQIVGAKTVSRNEWLDVHVDLTKFAGEKIKLSLENRANDWHCEWAYWNEISVVSK